MNRVFVDMDGVIVDFARYMADTGLTAEEVKRRPGAYLDMPAIPGALQAVRSLIGMGFEVWIATKPPTGIPYAYSDKAAWIMRELPELSRRIIVTHDKGLLGDAGDYLCDDRPHKANCEKFPGTLLRFVDGFHWPQALEFFRGLKAEKPIPAACNGACLADGDKCRCDKGAEPVDYYEAGMDYAYVESTDPAAADDWSTEDVAKAFAAGAKLALRDAQRATPAPAPAQGEAARAPLTDRTFRAMRSLVEAILTRADDDYMRRRLGECIAVMAEHGCEPPVPWPALGTTAEPPADPVRERLVAALRAMLEDDDHDTAKAAARAALAEAEGEQQ